MPDLDARLRALSDPEYRRFNESLIPGSDGRSFGVRMRDLRKLAREILKGDWRKFLREAPAQMHEHLLLQCLVSAMAPCSLEEKLEYVAALLPKIENWAQCDCLCSALKDAKKDPERVYEFLYPYLASSRVYEIRFGVVMLLNYFRTDVYIDHVLMWLKNIRNEDYYVQMAISWALSFCFISHREKTLALLKEKSLRPWIQNKAIQKCGESYRVSKEDKELLKELRI